MVSFGLGAGTNRKVSSSISCFTCNSRNHSDPNCHDPFHPAMSNYVESCKIPKQNHIGVFPARYCVKVIGKNEQDESLVIRACSLKNMDNQCGKFKFEGGLYHGCILTCDYDGCNGDVSIRSKDLSFDLISMICLNWIVFYAKNFLF